ncbi:winged helix-turn-helix domain-containing protein [Streptomyces sp. GMY02]|uniref:winged helix-turn-helix domain-containing protein n=1 Tax=Streptomyces sp. GMY02 TaxID=1333528 RepID=UPI001C2B8390|nr:winged helix-turn-helix domain-containing protein [Streptomyces sp. GMY02]QXE37249.1 winged helix-turn-helix domain-containing protein [Streptomyces sp. GMY02]
MSGDSALTEGQQRPRDVVADALRHHISQGELRVGERIPTQAELSEQYKVPRGAVRRALELLEHEGLIKRAQQGTPATVARTTPLASPLPAEPRGHGRADDVPAPRRHPPRPAGVFLGERVAQCFRHRRVTIDAYCLNGETLASALAGPLVALGTAGVRNPERIAVRILLPNADDPLALPQVVGEPANTRPRERLRETTAHIYGSLRHSLRMLTVRGLVPEVSVEARKVSISPTQKVYILNGQEVLAGHYQVQSRRVDLDRDDPIEIYDMLGVEGMLFRHTAVDDDHVTAAYVDQTQQWFDSLWNTIAVPWDS